MSSSRLAKATEETQDRINILLASLDDEQATLGDKLDIKTLQNSVDSLIHKYYVKHGDMQVEMNSLLEDLKSGMISRDQLESLVKSDQDRSSFVFDLAQSVAKQLFFLFKTFGGIISNADHSVLVSEDGESVEGILEDMKVAADTVDSLMEAVHVPAQDLKKIIDQTQKNLNPLINKTLSRGKPRRIRYNKHQVEPPLEPTTTSPLRISSDMEKAITESVIALQAPISDNLEDEQAINKEIYAPYRHIADPSKTRKGSRSRPSSHRSNGSFSAPLDRKGDHSAQESPAGGSPTTVQNQTNHSIPVNDNKKSLKGHLNSQSSNMFDDSSVDTKLSHSSYSFASHRTPAAHYDNAVLIRSQANSVKSMEKHMETLKKESINLVEWSKALEAREKALEQRIMNIDDEVSARVQAQTHAMKSFLESKRINHEHRGESSQLLSDDIKEFEDFSCPSIDYLGKNLLTDYQLQDDNQSRDSRSSHSRCEALALSDQKLHLSGHALQLGSPMGEFPSPLANKGSPLIITNSMRDNPFVKLDESSLGSLGLSAPGIELHDTSIPPPFPHSTKTTEVITIFAPLPKHDATVDTRDFDEYLAIYQQNYGISSNPAVAGTLAAAPPPMTTKTMFENHLAQKSNDNNTMTSSMHSLSSCHNQDSFSDQYVATLMENTLKELPIVDENPMGLTVRGYRPPPSISFMEELTHSTNPLLTLYQEFKAYIPELHKCRLFKAATGNDSYKSQESIKNLFSPIVNNLERMDTVANQVLLSLSSAESMMTEIILYMSSPEVNKLTLESILDQLYRKIGEIEILKVWIDVQLSEYRYMFEKARIVGLDTVPNLLQHAPEFAAALKLFVSCQGRSVEAQNRVVVLKHRSEKHNLDKLLMWGRGIESGMSHDSSHTNQHGGSKKIYSEEDVFLLKDYIEELLADLSQLKEDNEELTHEIFRVMQEGDKTPGALLFFAALHDPFTIQSMNQLLLQLGQLKGFSEGSNHIDFATLRKRIQVCMTCIPTLEKFSLTFQSMHQRWVKSRFASFTKKSLVGGNADIEHTCPLCCNDMRMGVLKPLPLDSSTLASAKVLEEKRLAKHKKIAHLVDVPQKGIRVKTPSHTLGDLILGEKSRQESMAIESPNYKARKKADLVSHSLPSLPSAILQRASTPQGLIQQLQDVNRLNLATGKKEMS